MTLWENLKKGLLDGLHTASDKTSEYTKIGRIKIDVLGVKKELEEKLVELGGRFYQQYVEKKNCSFKDDLNIQQLLNRIGELEKELNAYEKDLERIRQDDGFDVA